VVVALQNLGEEGEEGIVRKRERRGGGRGKGEEGRGKERGGRREEGTGTPGVHLTVFSKEKAVVSKEERL
jgi:hypothetical protein